MKRLAREEIDFAEDEIEEKMRKWRRTYVAKRIRIPPQGRVGPSPFDTKQKTRLDGCCMEYRATYEPCTPGYLRHT